LYSLPVTYSEGFRTTHSMPCALLPKIICITSSRGPQVWEMSGLLQFADDQITDSSSEDSSDVCQLVTQCLIQ
jgi:hypothetical protein